MSLFELQNQVSDLLVYFNGGVLCAAIYVLSVLHLEPDGLKTPDSWCRDEMWKVHIQKYSDSPNRAHTFFCPLLYIQSTKVIFGILYFDIAN